MYFLFAAVSDNEMEIKEVITLYSIMCSEAVSISRDIKQTSGLIKNEIPKNRM
jgi:hypothetical protein